MSNKPKRLVQQSLLFPALSTKKIKEGTGTRSAHTGYKQSMYSHQFVETIEQNVK